MDAFPILYSVGCPKCEVLKQKLTEIGCGFQLFTDLKKMIEMGIEAVPMLYADGKLMDFNEALEWIKQHKKQE